MTSVAFANVAKLNAAPINPAEFGARGDGVTDDTAALKATFDYAMPLGLEVVLRGSYLVSGAITTATTWAAADCHIHCVGDVRITVSAGATAFRGLLYCQSTAANNVTITGGSLTIDANNKCGEVIYFRHYAASQGGQVLLQAQVTVLNAKQHASETYTTGGILVIGDYALVTMHEPVVKNVSRLNSAAASLGIGISGFSGDCILYSPRVEAILTAGTAGSPSGPDADGILVFGKGNTVAYARTEGRAVLYSPVFIDCQGRGFKSQCSDVTVIRPYIKRQMVVVMNNGHDFDFQKGNGLIIEPEFEYRLNGAVPPVTPGNSFTPVSFQQNIDAFPMYAKCTGGVLKTEIQIPQFAYHYSNIGGSGVSANAYAETEISGLRIEPIGSFALSAFTRCIFETDMGAIESKTGKTKLILRDVSGPVDTAALGYTGYTSGSLASKLQIEVTGLYTTLPNSPTLRRVFGTVSGSQITSIESFLFRDNRGFWNIADVGFPVDFSALVAGCEFVVEIGDVTLVNGPPWGTSGYALVECLENFDTNAKPYVRVTVDTGVNANVEFFSRDGGLTWSSNAAQAVTAANIAAVGNAINTERKRQGQIVYDTTNNRLMIASGANANSPWYVADGSASVTPS
jgi:hypothetical protein